MNVVRAEAMGMCFGVKDAIAAAGDVIEPSKVTIHGELVHNGAVLAHLSEARIRDVRRSAGAQVPATPLVLITAHGVSEARAGTPCRSGKNTRGYHVSARHPCPRGGPTLASRWSLRDRGRPSGPRRSRRDRRRP